MVIVIYLLTFCIALVFERFENLYGNNFSKKSIALLFRESGYFAFKESECLMLRLYFFFHYQLSLSVLLIKTEAVTESDSLKIA